MVPLSLIEMWLMLTSLSSYFHFYTISSVPAYVAAGVSDCEGDCGACQGGGANYFDCEGLSLVSGGDDGVVAVL